MYFYQVIQDGEIVFETNIEDLAYEIVANIEEDGGLAYVNTMYDD